MIGFIIFCILYYVMVWILVHPKFLHILGEQIINLSEQLKDL